GMRAMAIHYQPPDKVAGGFILPNTWVDVILITTDKDGTEVAKVVFKKVIVLAVSDLIKRAENRNRKMPDTVVLAVKPVQVLKVAEAKEQGRLAFAPRANKDTDD